jgi:Fe-S oxidoreductase
MARMKIEVQAARAEKYGLTWRDRLVAYLPHYAPYAAKLSWLLNLRDVVPGAKEWSEKHLGFSARRSMPRWRFIGFTDPARLWWLRGKRRAERRPDAGEVVLFADTFNRYFERENLFAAYTVLSAAGYRVHIARPAGRFSRPLCCGRTFLATGQVDQARAEAERTVTALEPFVSRGVPVIGVEPSCVLGFRDEVPAILKSEAAVRLSEHAYTFEEFLAREAAAGRLQLPLKKLGWHVLVHGHCHQKAFDAFGAVETVLKLVPDLKVETIESSCCGMAGAFGYDPATIDVSLAMAELSLLPAIRKASAESIIVADGTSCRHQIHDGTGREAFHAARVLATSLKMPS